MAVDKYTEVEFQAWEFVPDVTNGPQAVTRQTDDTGYYDHLAFDSATDEYAYVPWPIPEDFDTTAGEMKVRVYYETAVTSGTAAWQFGIAGYADNEDLDAAYSNLTDIAAETVEGSARYLSVGAATTVDATALGALTKGDLAILRINRDVSADTAAGDVNLIKLVIQYKALGANNASWSGTAAGSGEWYKELWIPAIKWVGDKAAPPAFGTRTAAASGQSAHYHFLSFDDGTGGADEHGYYYWRIPDDWDTTALTASYKTYWEADDTSAVVHWRLKGEPFGDDEDLDTSTGAGPVTKADISQATARNLSVGGEQVFNIHVQSPAGGEALMLRVTRDSYDNASDTLTGDARLIGILFQYRVKNANNAAWS